MNRLKISIEDLKLFRTLFLVSIVAVPAITYFYPAFSSLYILILIFFGFGFSNYSKWFLFPVVIVLASIKAIILQYDFSLLPFLTDLFVYFIIIYIVSEIKIQFMEKKQTEIDLVASLSKSLDARNTYTANHSHNVSKYAVMIAKEMEFSKTECDAIEIGGLLHDIGKIGINEAVLTKPSRLTDDEKDHIRLHPLIGYETIKHISFFEEMGVLDMILYHHERYDGRGYPAGLKGNEIPLAARIIAVADSFDAMTTDRPYRNKLVFESVKNELLRNKATQFDPEIVDIFMRVIENNGIHIA